MIGGQRFHAAFLFISTDIVYGEADVDTQTANETLADEMPAAAAAADDDTQAVNIDTELPMLYDLLDDDDSNDSDGNIGKRVNPWALTLQWYPTVKKT